MKITASVTVTDRTGEVLRALDRELPAAVEEAAKAVLGRVQARTPKKSGNLADSEEARRVTSLEWEVVAGGDKAPYAAVVEQHHPFMAPAAEESMPDFEQAVKDVLKRIGAG